MSERIWDKPQQPETSQPPQPAEIEVDHQVIDLREIGENFTGLDQLEYEFIDDAPALQLNTAMALVAALRGSGIVLRTNTDTTLLGIKSSDIIAQGIERLIRPEESSDPEAYERIFNATVPPFRQGDDHRWILQKYLADRASYLDDFNAMDNEARYFRRSTIIETELELSQALEKFIDEHIQELISDHETLPPERIDAEVLDEFTLHLVPDNQPRGGLNALGATALVNLWRTSGLSPQARIWFRHQYEAITANN